MEEAVTRKFVHEESGSITSLCGKVLLIIYSFFFFCSKMKLKLDLKLQIQYIIFVYKIASDENCILVKYSLKSNIISKI